MPIVQRGERSADRRLISCRLRRKLSLDRHFMTRPFVSFRAIALVGALLACDVALAQSQLLPGVELPKPSKGNDGISADLFYRLLLGDVALQRGDATLAARAYLDAAREAQDARIAKRAT